jgi:hypothetical protein
MTSNINYSGIDPTFPVAGVDNDSQGFRDNFLYIKNGLETAAGEITALQANAATTNASSTSFNNNTITSVNLLNYTEGLYSGGIVIADTNIDYSQGVLQTFSLGSPATSVQFTLLPNNLTAGTGFPAANEATVRVLINNNDSTPRTFNFVVGNGGSLLKDAAVTRVSTTGTIGSISGTGPWTATITGMTDTSKLTVGAAITATGLSGALYGGSPSSCVVASIVSSTSITYTVTGGTTPVAGTVANITTPTPVFQVSSSSSYTGFEFTTYNGGSVVFMRNFGTFS